MKTPFIALTLIAVGTAAFAGNSDRYNDLRLDTSKTAQITEAEAPSAPVKVVALTTSGQEKAPYAYESPYGVGPNNDSR